MADNTYLINKFQEDLGLETEDGEIDDKSSAEIKLKEDEVETYYLSLNELGRDLRCSCCGDVYSDPVKLKCEHLIDRSCAVIKKNGNVIECFLCHQNTICDDVDELITDFNIASRIPPKPDTLIAIINKHRGQLLKYNQENKINLYNDCIDEGTFKSRKRKRKTRWDKIENVPQTFTGAIMDILASHNLPKNITMSQFKKFTEISNKSTIMSLLTKAVLQSVNAEVQKKNAKYSGSYSDSEILDLIPPHNLKDLFEVEKIQFILLYRDALDKGVLTPPSPNKFPKLPLLPTPKSIESSNSNNGLSHESYRKLSTPESVESDFSDKSSPASCSVSNQCKKFDVLDLNLKNETMTETVIPLTETVVKDEKLVSLDEVKESDNLIDSKLVACTNGCTEELDENTGSTDNPSREESARYRDRVNKLHSIYSSMYNASLKMKELGNQIKSPDYQSAYKTYSDNYNQYQSLYSSLQTAISIDSVVTDKSDSLSLGHSSENKIPKTDKNQAVTVLSQNYCESVTPVIGFSVNNVLLNVPELATSTTTLIGHSVDLTESLVNTGETQFSGTPLVRSSVSHDPQQFRNQMQLNNKNKFGYLWISNLCKEARTKDLCKLFSKFGHVSKVKLFQYKALTPTTFFSLIFMPNFTEAEAACRELQNTTFFDKPIHIKMLCPPIDAS